MAIIFSAFFGFKKSSIFENRLEIVREGVSVFFLAGERLFRSIIMYHKY